MAANPFDPLNAGVPFFDIYHDPLMTAPAGAAPALPGGACNYVDLTPGANGAKCGCRRFWFRAAAGSPTLDGAGWCMCNHHACFHDEGPRDVPSAEVTGPGQENERPRTSRPPLSPVVDLSLAMPPPPPATATEPDLPIFPVDPPLSFIYDNPEHNSPDTITRAAPPSLTPQPFASLPDTLPWGDTPRSEVHVTKPTFPPSQALMASQATSTTSSTRMQYLRPFAGKGLDTLAADAHPHSGLSSELRPDHLESDAPRDPATANGSPPSVATGARDTQPELRDQPSQTPAVSKDAFKNLSDAVSGHEQRLDRLETVSFSAAAHDDCQERNDHMDLRVTDLESRMEEVEKANAEHGAAVARIADKNDDATTQSVASFSTTTDTSRPTLSQELYSQVQSLQAQVSSLQSSLPSFANPWEVEVVFLPFPLKKVWQEMQQFKQDSTAEAGGDDWTQLPMTYSSGGMRSQSPMYDDWASADHDAEWLLPRACADTSAIDKRLRSRGLIKNISVKGPDARSVNIAMNAVFGDAWGEMKMAPPASQLDDPRLSKFMGLQSMWVPLRKIHKDSRLRFLSPAEMLNPTVWTVQFLNSIMMRSSEPRLFVTHPSAYLQDHHAYETGWSWQRVREMTRVYPGVSASQEVPEADALEECWSWSDQLDEQVPGANTSMSMRSARRGHHPVTWSFSQRQTSVPRSFRRSSSPLVTAGPTSILRDRRGLRHAPIRTASLPTAAQGHLSPALTRRRVVSSEHSRRSSPSVRGGTRQFAVPKRLGTRSPSYPRHTPRWTASPSPMPPSATDRQHVRGTTPFAYATPHSNGPLQEVPLPEMHAIRASSAAPIPPEYMPDSHPEMDDDLYDIEIYESEDSDASYHNDDDDNDSSDDSHHPLADTTAQHLTESDFHHRQLPEDEPRPGIEGQSQFSDDENMDPTHILPDHLSDMSSQPSEYPSTQRPWPESTAGFHIHEDQE